MSKEKSLRIRNSTAEFLIFSNQAGENSIEVRVEDETVWLTQKLIGVLFEVTVPTVNEHLTNIYQQGEITQEATVRNFRIVQKEGNREVTRNVDCYNLDAIISVGYRVNSARAIQFRQWATSVLRDFAIRGYVLDKERLKKFYRDKKDEGDETLKVTGTILVNSQNFPFFAVIPCIPFIL